MTHKWINKKAIFAAMVPAGISGFHREALALVTGARLKRDGLKPCVLADGIDLTFRLSDGHLPDFQPRVGLLDAMRFVSGNPFSEAVLVTESPSPMFRKVEQPRPIEVRS